MTSRQNRALLTVLNGMITASETALQHPLPGSDRELLTDICLHFLESAIPKFVRGSKEHGGLLTDRPAMPELGDELIDAIMYHSAARKQLSALSR